MHVNEKFIDDAFLTQERLYTILQNIYPDSTIIYNKSFPKSLYTPDFYIPELHILVEYDGNLHYCRPSNILSDARRDVWFSDKGIHTLRIPYFIQLNTRTIKDILGVDFEYTQVYPHGFIDKKAVLPAEFSELGVERFLTQIDKYNYLKDDIRVSLEKKICELGDERLVINSVIKSYFW